MKVRSVAFIHLSQAARLKEQLLLTSAFKQAVPDDFVDVLVRGGIRKNGRPQSLVVFPYGETANRTPDLFYAKEALYH